MPAALSALGSAVGILISSKPSSCPAGSPKASFLSTYVIVRKHLPLSGTVKASGTSAQACGATDGISSDPAAICAPSSVSVQAALILSAGSVKSMWFSTVRTFLSESYRERSGLWTFLYSRSPVCGVLSG